MNNSTDSARRALVRSGYDAISYAYKDDEGRPGGLVGDYASPYPEWVAELRALLRPGSRVLDLGCGAGVPGARLLVQSGLRVTGLDFSHVQIERARRLVPQAEFIEADMAEWDCEPESFEAVVSFYALIHVPLSDQRALFPRVRRWLKPRGYFMAIVGHDRWTGVEEYYGSPMFWDDADDATYLRWFAAAGFEVLSHRFVPEGDSGHTLVLAVAD